MKQNYAQFKVSEIKIVYQSKVKLNESPKICCSSDSFDIFLNNWNLEELELRESFKILLLNRNNIKGYSDNFLEEQKR